MRESNKFDHNLIRNLRRLEDEEPGDYSKSRLHVSVGYTGELRDLENSGLRVIWSLEGLAIGDIAAGELEKLAQLDNVRQISMEGPLGVHLDKSVPEIHADLVQKDPDTPYTGAGVVIGIIDSGIDIYHKNFRRPDGTSRILAIWDQTISPPGTHPPAAPFNYGAEFDANAIKAALDNPDQPFPHKDRLGHGSHVAGIAAGNGSQKGNCHGAGKYVGVAPEADLIAVKIVPDSASTNRNTNMLHAVLYLYRASVLQHPPKPAVINISVRAGIGPHDGTTHLETAIDQVLEHSKGFAVIVSAGNDGRKGTDGDWQRGTYNAGFHTSKQIAAHGHISIALNVPPNRTASDNLEVWYSAGAGRLAVQVTDPTGAAAGPIAAGSNARVPVGPATVGITSSVNDPNNQKGHISISIDPPPNGVIRAGAWSVTLTETAGTAVSMDLWLINLEDHPTTVLDFADRVIATTVNSPATAKNVIAVGAYASKHGDLGEFSSRGPSLAPDNRQKPDICAPGFRDGDASGITAPAGDQTGGCCCDCCYDFYVDRRGTSQSAPHVAGVVSLMLQKNGNLTFDQLRATIQTFCRKPGGVAPLPNNDWGFGKVDAQLATANIPPGSALTGDPAVTADAGDPGDIIVPTGRLSSQTTAPQASKRRIEPFPRLRDLFRPSALRIGKALQDVADRGKGNPGAQMMMALISTHFDEVFALIGRNRRVATKWHRMFGPLVLRHMLWNPEGSQSLIPSIVQDQNVSERMRDLFAVLCRYGSAGLRTDLRNYGDFLLAIPGAGFPELNTLSEIACGPSWNT